MLEFIAPSGAIVKINPASYKAANELKKAIEREILDCDIGNAIKMAMIVDSSDKVEAALWPCLNRCLYNDQKIIESTFDSLEARKDYHAIAYACGEYNLRPFVDGLSSQFQKMGLSKSQQENAPAL